MTGDIARFVCASVCAYLHTRARDCVYMRPQGPPMTANDSPLTTPGVSTGRECNSQSEGSVGALIGVSGGILSKSEGMYL